MIKKSTAIRFLILVVITICTVLILKFNPQFKTTFYKHVYNDNISFAMINNWYQSKFGSPLPFSKWFDDSATVFNEQLKYSGTSIYKDGVRLEVGSEYLVPALDSGIVVFTGEKEGYGNTVIIEQADGIAVWYSNLEEINVKLYDYLSKGNLVGLANNDLYLVFYKNGEALDYQDRI